MKPRWIVVTENGLSVFEGSHAQCSNYIKQAIRKGSQPGYLHSVPAADFEKEVEQ